MGFPTLRLGQDEADAPPFTPPEGGENSLVPGRNCCAIAYPGGADRWRDPL